ncbi:TPR-like protein [Cylindrobasidium torrendii FP15055 ss-10]|uniref:TPR-like protein n=1 Tax=Cylindrobasidium torrendii FP15055 ss-10 TaxID=1314674 RepID=A0A0D7BLC4_9AGAR|nr:TPR-like protein [Cylindrobasidium torrendii FP15055 ss-10]
MLKFTNKLFKRKPKSTDVLQVPSSSTQRSPMMSLRSFTSHRTSHSGTSVASATTQTDATIWDHLDHATSGPMTPQNARMCRTLLRDDCNDLVKTAEYLRLFKAVVEQIMKVDKVKDGGLYSNALEGVRQIRDFAILLQMSTSVSEDMSDSLRTAFKALQMALIEFLNICMGIRELHLIADRQPEGVKSDRCTRDIWEALTLFRSAPVVYTQVDVPRIHKQEAQLSPGVQKLVGLCELLQSSQNFTAPIAVTGLHCHTTSRTLWYQTKTLQRLAASLSYRVVALVGESSRLQSIIYRYIASFPASFSRVVFLDGSSREALQLDFTRVFKVIDAEGPITKFRDVHGPWLLVIHKVYNDEVDLAGCLPVSFDARVLVTGRSNSITSLASPGRSLDVSAGVSDETVLGRLEQWLHVDRIARRVVTLVGDTQAGKTLLVRKYVTENQHSFRNVFFVDASTRETLDRCGRIFMQKFGQPIQDWLDEHAENNLLILDNATDGGLLVPYMPCRTHANVVITSRDSRIADTYASPGCSLRMADIPKAESKDKGDDTTKEAERPALHIDIGEKAVEAQPTTVTSTQAAGPAPSKVVEEAPPSPVSVFQVADWTEHCFPPFYGDTEEEAAEEAAEETVEIAVEEAVQDTQTATHTGAQTAHSDDPAQLVARAEEYIAANQHELAEPLLSGALQRRKAAFGIKDERTIYVLVVLAGVNHNLGRYSLAEELYLEATEFMDEVFGAEHHNTLLVMHGLAATVWWLGRPEEAIAKMQRCVAISRNVFPTHNETIKRTEELFKWMNNLSSSHFRKEQYEEAKSLQIAALQLAKDALDSQSLALAMATLASTHFRRRKYRKAEALYSQSLEIRRADLGLGRDADTLACLADLATTHWCLKRRDEAVSEMRECIELSRETLGSVHTTTIERKAQCRVWVMAHSHAMGVVALRTSKKGRHGDAENLSAKALRLAREVLGDEHPVTAYAMANMAALYLRQERYSDAEPLYVESLRILVDLLGLERCAQTAECIRGLAIAHWFIGRCDDAISGMRRCVGLSQDLLGFAHGDTVERTLKLNVWVLLAEQGLKVADDDAHEEEWPFDLSSPIQICGTGRL